MTKRIAITTGGGDAPGLNAVIRAVTLASHRRGWECLGIRSGFDGILHPEDFKDGGTIDLNPDSVRGIAHTGGTILGTTNRGNPFSYEVENDDGTVSVENISDRVLEGFKKHKIDMLVAIGGDGSMGIAAEVAKLGEDAKAMDAELNDILMGIPNVPFDDVPDGEDENDNVEVKKWGTPASFDFKPVEHFELAAVQGGMDFEVAAKGDAPVPSHHSPLFKVSPEPSIKSGVAATVYALLELMPK